MLLTSEVITTVFKFFYFSVQSAVFWAYVTEKKNTELINIQRLVCKYDFQQIVLINL